MVKAAPAKKSSRKRSRKGGTRKHPSKDSVMLDAFNKIKQKRKEELRLNAILPSCKMERTQIRRDKIKQKNQLKNKPSKPDINFHYDGRVKQLLTAIKNGEDVEVNRKRLAVLENNYSQLVIALNLTIVKIQSGEISVSSRSEKPAKGQTKLENFFVPTKQSLRRKIEATYKDFYYDKIANSEDVINIPSYEELETRTQDVPTEIDANVTNIREQRKIAKIKAEMNEGKVKPCSNCGATDFVEDSQHGEITCRGCGVVGKRNVTQVSFSDNVTFRTPSPGYDKIQHVSLFIDILISYTSTSLGTFCLGG
jgi:hypothetical protein